MSKPFHFWGGLTVAGVLWGTAVWVSSGAARPGMPPYTTSVMPAFAVQDTATVLNGARRFGADLAFIQLMQYYGSPEFADPQVSYPLRRKPHRYTQNNPHKNREDSHPHNEKGHERAHEGAHAHLHLGSEGTADATGEVSPGFPLLGDFALRAGTLDPRFHFAYLFVSGALAFNLNRGDDAVRVLEHGIRGDPSFWRYRMYQGAIAYRKSQETEKVIATLEEAIKDPDCPSMIKNILAHIYIKKGNPKRAAEIYVDLLESRDPSYATHAKTQLIRLGVIRP